MPTHQMKFASLESPVGSLLLARNGKGLCEIRFPGRESRGGKPVVGPEPSWIEDEAAFSDVIGQLGLYFAGDLKTFDLPLAPTGTEFQCAVWRELERIPYGETISYGELARRVGNPKASRAVGAANGANPIPIVVPCHRVIGSSGKLVGFGGGLDTKRALLDHERGGFLF